MTAAPDHGADTTPAHISRVRGQIGDAAASTSDLLDLLTAGLAEDDRHPGDQTTRAAHDNIDVAPSSATTTSPMGADRDERAATRHPAGRRPAARRHQRSPGGRDGTDMAMVTT